MQMARATRAEWAKRVERWQDSGLTAKEFAAELEISPNSLTFWKWKLRQTETGGTSMRGSAHRREKSKRRETPTRFLQLVPAPDAPVATSTLEVMFANGVVLRVPKDFDEPALARLVNVLGGR
jgi:transposase-like protein